MTYIKRDIKDRITEFPSRYKMTNVSGDVYDLVPQTGNIIQEGTKINKAYLQPIEDTLEDITTPKYGVATGTNSYVVTVPKITTLVIGLQLMIKFTNASTGATSINVNGLGNKSLIKAGGGSPKIKANGIYTIGYDGTSFQLLGEGGEYGTAQASDVLSPKTIGTDNGLVTGTMLTAINSSPYEQSSELYIGGGGVTYMKISSSKYYPAGTWLTFTEPNLIASNVRVGAILGSTTKITGTYTGLGNAPVGNVLAGSTFSTATLSNATGTMVNRGAVTSTLTTQGGAYTIPSGYHSGAGKVTASFANLVAGNVKSGVNIGGVVGNVIPLLVMPDGSTSATKQAVTFSYSKNTESTTMIVNKTIKAAGWYQITAYKSTGYTYNSRVLGYVEVNGVRVFNIDYPDGSNNDGFSYVFQKTTSTPDAVKIYLYRPSVADNYRTESCQIRFVIDISSVIS